MKNIATTVLITFMALFAHVQAQNLTVFHEVKPNQTIEGIVGTYQIFNVTQEDIAKENKGTDLTAIKEGQIIKVRMKSPFGEIEGDGNMSDKEFFRRYYGGGSPQAGNANNSTKTGRKRDKGNNKKTSRDENGNPISGTPEENITTDNPNRDPLNLDFIKNPHFSLSAYIDVYYAAYSDVADSLKYPAFQSVSPINKSIGLNIIQLAGGYAKNNLRMNFAFHFGDIPRFSWAGPYQYIQEANIGYNVYDNIWVDLGFFTTHIGTESMTPKDNLMSTWALTTFHEPLLQSGVKISYEGENGISAAFHVLDGYNAFVSPNNKLSFGMGLGWEKGKFAVGYSNQISDEAAATDEKDQTRFYNNWWATLSFDKVFVQMGFDFGMQTNSKLEHLGDGTAIAYGALVSAKYNPYKNLYLFGRVEYFEDQHGFLSGTFTDTEGYDRGLNATAYTLGLEYTPTPGSYLRFERKQTITPNRSELEIFNNYWKDSAPITNKQNVWMVTAGLVVDL